MNPFETKESKNIKSWKEEMSKAIKSGNEDLYIKQLDSVL